MARTIDLNVTTYWWIPGDAGIANPDAVSAAILTAGTNISAHLHSSTSVNATSSDTVSEKGITDVANVVTPIIGNYEGTLVGFRDMTAGVPSATDLLTLVGKTAGILGWVVRRKGLASGTAAAVAQLVDVFKFATDNPSVTGGQGDGMLKTTIPLFQQGVFRIETALVA